MKNEKLKANFNYELSLQASETADVLNKLPQQHLCGSLSTYNGLRDKL